MKRQYLCLVLLCAVLLSIAALANGDDRKTFVVDATGIYADGLVHIAQLAANSAGMPTLSTATQPTTMADTESEFGAAAATQPATSAVSQPADDVALDEISKAIGSNISTLGNKCAPMKAEEFRTTLAGMIKIIDALESRNRWRSTLCAVELRTRCLTILSARSVALGETFPDIAADLLESQLDARQGKKYQALLVSTFPQWKEQIESLPTLSTRLDWYALYNLACTGDTKAWPDHNNNPIGAAIMSYLVDQSFQSKAPNIRNMAFAVLANEMERLRMVWLIRMKKEFGTFPKEREAFMAAIKAHITLTKDDVMPLSGEPIDAMTLWKFYIKPFDLYGRWTKEKKPQATMPTTRAMIVR